MENTKGSAGHMNLTNAIMDLVLMGLLVAALWFGVRLDKKLKALRGAHEGFARAVADLDQAAIRAHHSLKELRSDADDSQELLHGRILAARDLLQKIEGQASRAERAALALDSRLETMNSLQSRAEQTARRLETAPREVIRVAAPEPVRPQPRLEDDADYNPAWSAPKAPVVARGQNAAAEASVASAKRDPFERDMIRFTYAKASDRPVRRQSVLPQIEEDDESEIMDKVQMSELVVANLNEMIRSLTLPTRQVLSVEDDLFGGEDQGPRKR